jgi:hypothetical protein
VDRYGLSEKQRLTIERVADARPPDEVEPMPQSSRDEQQESRGHRPLYTSKLSASRAATGTRAAGDTAALQFGRPTQHPERWRRA